MLRCKFCGGHAHPALAHLHGMTEPLCYDCTKKVLEKRQERFMLDAFLQSWKEEVGLIEIMAKDDQRAA